MKTTFCIAMVIAGLLGLFPPMNSTMKSTKRGYLFSPDLQAAAHQIDTGKLLGEVLVVGLVAGLVALIVPFDVLAQQLPASKSKNG